ncbi:hypothetical protein ASG42_23170 [Rhizobium sp. Leaf391]|nr:hypothetical protein ASG42_23170 [Rhizobium sp. Leaf391]
MGEIRKRAGGQQAHVCSVSPILISTDAGEIEVTIFGNRSGPALILLPHGLADWSSFESIAVDLAAKNPGLRVVALSRPGCGRTPAIDASVIDPQFYEASFVVPALMDKLEIPHASFVGHMDGASIALMLGGLFPKRVRGIAAFAAYGFADDYLRTALNAIQFRGDGPEWLSNLQGGGAEPDAHFRRWRENRLAECERGWSAIEFFDGITAPVLFIQGSRDEFVSVDQVASIATRLRGKVCWVTLRNAGHLLHHECPQQVTALLQGQLEQCSREGPVLQSQSFHVPVRLWRDGPDRLDITESQSSRMLHALGSDDRPSRLQIA